MKHFHDEWIQEWCEGNGWTELFRERYNNYWAFPPGAVIPEPIPPKTMMKIKAKKGLCFEEKLWVTLAVTSTFVAIILSYLLKCPMPLVLAFAFAAITVARLEMEDF